MQNNISKIKQKKNSRIKKSFFKSKTKNFSNIYVNCFRSISKIDEHLWDTINISQDIFNSHKFLSCIEKSKIENSQYWYLIFYFNEKPVGSAVLSSFNISFDLFTTKTIQKIVNIFRKKYPNFLKLNVLFCGIPISIGKNTLTISNGAFLEEILHSVVLKMEKIANQNEINYICIKEFREDEVIWLNPLSELGFLRIESIPYVYLLNNWSSFKEYLGQMRHNYRRQILQSLFDKTSEYPIIENHDPSMVISKSKDSMILLKPSQFDPKCFYKLYLQVMDRVKTKLEILNENFFINAFKLLEDDSLILVASKNNETTGAAYIIMESDRITFLLVGLDYGYKNHHKVLMNLLYGIVSVAIKSGCRIIDLGQTSYELKQRIGGKCTKEYFFLKSSNGIVNFLFRLLRPMIFPIIQTRKRRVFNSP